MKRGLLALLLVTVMLAGCGSKSESSQPAQNNVQVNDNRTATDGTGNGSTVVDNRQKLKSSL